jgi:hypothetical protein
MDGRIAAELRWPTPVTKVFAPGGIMASAFERKPPWHRDLP